MDTLAVVLEEPERIALNRVELLAPAEGDVIVDVEWSGISTGTEKLLWSGRMPPFPGMGYPLVPGYESVGRIRGSGQRVFVPGARCFRDVRGLFGGAAAHLVVPAARALPIDEHLGERGALLALAATAQHAIGAEGPAPELIVGHGVLGRLLARLAVLRGGAPVVWERNPDRRDSGGDYAVVDPDDDLRRDYAVIADVSGDSALLDTLIGRLRLGGEIVLAGFYAGRLDFAFPPAFMREARLRIAAQWQECDLLAVKRLVEEGRLSLDGLISHRVDAAQAPDAYRTAFSDPACLKMILDWRACP